MTTALDPHVAPTHVDTRTPIFEATWRDHTVTAAFADFDLCDTCGAILDQPCRTASGAKAKRNHKGRGA